MDVSKNARTHAHPPTHPHTGGTHDGVQIEQFIQFVGEFDRMSIFVLVNFCSRYYEAVITRSSEIGQY